MPLANDSLSPCSRGRTCRWIWKDELEGGVAVVDNDVGAVGVQPRLAGGQGDALTDAHHLGDRVRRGDGQVDGVVLGHDQGVATREPRRGLRSTSQFD
jgi:hypothetical protein